MHWPISRWLPAMLIPAVLASCGGGTPAASVIAVSIPEGPPAATTTLAASVQQLALKVSGETRAITMTNTGSEEVQSLGLVWSGMPDGTRLTMTTCGATLAPGASCRFFFTPGATATATPGDLAPSTAVIEIVGSNTNTVSVNLSVIDYGSVYQGGYVFAIDDSTHYTGSIGGKVAALSDLAAMAWTTAPSPIAVDGAFDTSTSPCQALTDGACTSTEILTAYSTDAPAASACGASAAGGFDDWYLPAICEMGYSGNCGSPFAPRLADNMQSRLVDNGNIAQLAGATRLSSTLAFFADPNGGSVLTYDFTPAGGSIFIGPVASPPRQVRCVRALTP